MTSMDQSETLIERTLSNLAGVWRDIAHSAARTIGRASPDPLAADAESLSAFMRECLEARGGEVSARMRTAELGETYLKLDREGRERFLTVLAEGFAVDHAVLQRAIAEYHDADTAEAMVRATGALRQATIPPRVRLLMQFNALPDGVKFLVDLRADLLAMKNHTPALKGLDRDLHELLASWFDTGFLILSNVTWDSPAALLEKLIAYEAVHEIRSWEDLRNRVDSDRRLFALFHPRMPEEPLAFVEVALVRGIARNVQALLDESAPKTDLRAADTAIFYSITNTQKGLRGISFGEFLIKRVVQRLASELPQIKNFVTLSPLPGFRRWLEGCPREAFLQALSEPEQGGIRALAGDDEPQAALRAILDRPDWFQDPVIVKALKDPMLRLTTHYLLTRREDGQPIDPVARFHLKNGARLEHINWLADTSEQGLRQSAGMMVNYRYSLDEIESNHEAYMNDQRIALGAEVRSLARSLNKPNDNGGRASLRRLGLR